ncbi:ATP-binding protein [Palleniella muris]|uniref:ATP-binding protein n=1 Tax=Palleniella muris TaxID=3038145 RepID=A0AC61QML7_9BACT|nr:AAA family ATPase [Palleniella muris]TGX80529.1 ATP-binding protein [Palleniella muris]
MLTKFATKNYRGFSDRIEWDLSHPSSYSFNNNAIKDGIVKNGIIYGPNGAGKSNLALALFDLILHLTQKNKNPHQTDTVINVYHPQELVEFEYTFKFGASIIEYTYAKSPAGIEQERITIDGKMVFNLEDNRLSLEGDEFPMTAENKHQLANSSNKVSVLGYLWSVYPLDSEHPLTKLKEFVNGMLLFWNHEERGFAGLDERVSFIEEFIIANGLVSDFSKFLESVSGQEFKFKNPNKGDTQLICDMGNGVPFNKIRSTGTSSLTLLYFWTQKMSKASFVMIDEFDAFYHFALSFNICKKLFAYSNQIFVTSHNTYLMSNDLLRPDCNFIIGNCRIKPLNACTEKELRWGNNIEKMYRGDAFEI